MKKEKEEVFDTFSKISRAEFAEKVEELVHQSEGLTYFDAVTEILARNDIEFEGIQRFLSHPLKEKLFEEGKELKLVKKEVYTNQSEAHLPINE